MKVGILHPGAMGAALAAAASTPIHWASEGRSPETRDRAAAQNLVDLGTVANLVANTSVLISVCPPDAATRVAEDVARLGFSGTYVDANAVAPSTVRQMADQFDSFVDGGIIGPPPLEAGTTRLYLAGDEAEMVADLWTGSNIGAVVLDGAVGTASALKVAYAGWTKGSSALLLAMRAYAQANGLSDELISEWDLSIPGLSDRSEATAGRIGMKAWRFEGEMREIASALRDAGLPDGFHEAATEVYGNLSDFKGIEKLSVDEVNVRLLGD